ncbi:porin [Paraburkholderia sp. CNPSo 3272]|uniref:porin n=1 Tax=Paraburkholderia sp. CNPSo 3272 TaxID=2940931 RepID=UPI0020B87D8C|nr:porin [Paraburkholderia sp. CNPSo 3272]MCP3725537.1 porin [Paraburkholderia sp. CNPSo 3272]
MSRTLRAARAWAVLSAATFATLHTISAHAQSSVTLYGALDTSIEVTNPGAGWVARMDSGAYRGSRFGLRGVEDIGDGIKILFELENGFGSNDGTFAVANTIFNRQAWIGLGTQWGTVRVGRQYSPIYIPFKGQLDAFGAGTIASGLNNLSKITPYESNAITYLSPDIYGFSTTLMASLRDPSTGSNGLAGNIETVEWRRGPFRIAYAHQQQNGDGALRANLGGMSYVLGPVSGYLAYFNGDGGTPRNHNNGVSVSARYAITSRFRASLGYAWVHDLSGADNDADQFSAACEYDLSKHVLLYASAGWLRNRAEATFTLRGVNVTGLPPSWPGAPVRGVQFGMIDRF